MACAGREQRRIEEVSTKVLLGMANRSLRRALDGWMCSKDERRRLQMICSRIVSHWTHRKSAAALDGWRACAISQVTSTLVAQGHHGGLMPCIARGLWSFDA